MKMNPGVRRYVNGILSAKVHREPLSVLCMAAGPGGQSLRLTHFPYPMTLVLLEGFSLLFPHCIFFLPL